MHYTRALYKKKS